MPKRIESSDPPNEPGRRLETIFHASRERAPGPEREAYLDGACGSDRELRARVAALLEAHEEASGFLEQPAVESTREREGSSIGVYRLLQEIGEGGMGVVYMAEQEEPVRRKVALKVIKLGMDTKQVIARFEAERQALAMMDHPNIARVLDAGATDAGRPYFVMELVRGIAINEYCDTHKLDTAERLRLFVDVCSAVQHAHQKGIIHRDLKPTNVLVTSHDGTPVPKIIDFGVAKATNQKLTERTLFTEFRQIIGTPEYMSPEQAEMSGLDVDTRSDIYSLGVLLYQLLTGTTPVDPAELRTAGFEEMTRMIREDEPPAPSTRVSKLGAGAESVAGSRRSDVGSLSKHFQGDLDWIVMKALEKDRTRRYVTASDFARDVERHLANEPVEAGPPGASYRLRKFVRRNQRAVVAALVLAFVVALGLTGTTAGFLRARAERDRSLAMSSSLEEVLAMTDSARTSEPGEIEGVLETVRSTFGDDHATFAAVLDTLSRRLHDAGDFDAATELCRQAIDVWERVHGQGHPNVGMARARLGTVLFAQGLDDEAEVALRGALDILDGAADAPGLVGYEARVQLAELLGNRGESAEASELLGEALALLRSSPSPSRSRVIETLEQRFLVQLNDVSSNARETLGEIYDELRAFYADDSPRLAISALTLGNYLVQVGDSEAAEPFVREAIRRMHDAGMTGGHNYVSAHDSLFQILRTRSDPETVRETDEVLRKTIELARSYWSIDTLVGNLDYYGQRMLQRGRYDAAIETVLEVISVLEENDAATATLANARHGLALVVYRTTARPGRDPEVYVRAVRAVEDELAGAPDDPALLTALAGALVRSGQPDLAIETLDLVDGTLAASGVRMARRLAPADHAFRALAYLELEELELARSELDALRDGTERAYFESDAIALLAEAREFFERVSSGSADG